MDRAAAELAMCALIAAVRSRPDEAVGIARAAESCAESGQAAQAVRILMDFEGSAHSEQDLFKAALTIKRHLLPDQI
jgi:hypothetical protein